MTDANGIYTSSIKSEKTFVYKQFPENMTVKINDSDTNIIAKVGDELKATATNSPEGVTIKFK